MAEIQEIVFKVAECVPYQLCPKCNGQGTVSKPPYVPGDVHEWSSSQYVFTCDICEGTKIIPMHVIPNLCQTANVAE